MVVGLLSIKGLCRWKTPTSWDGCMSRWLDIENVLLRMQPPFSMMLMSPKRKSHRCYSLVTAPSQYLPEQSGIPELQVQIFPRKVAEVWNSSFPSPRWGYLSRLTSSNNPVVKGGNGLLFSSSWQAKYCVYTNVAFSRNLLCLDLCEQWNQSMFDCRSSTPPPSTQQP